VVGGDTDVAVVTRHERFKWVKRKHLYCAVNRSEYARARPAPMIVRSSRPGSLRAGAVSRYVIFRSLSRSKTAPSLLAGVRLFGRPCVTLSMTRT
jgi:hypothetical protein